MPPSLITVRLLELPVPLHARASAHADALQREFELIVHDQSDHLTVPSRLLELIEDLNARFGAVGDQPQAELDAAVDAGIDQIDLIYLLPTEAGEASRQLDALLDEADAFCRAGQHLLTLAAPEDVIGYRRWFLNEISAQIDGSRPTPWP